MYWSSASASLCTSIMRHFTRSPILINPTSCSPSNTGRVSNTAIGHHRHGLVDGVPRRTTNQIRGHQLRHFDVLQIGSVLAHAANNVALRQDTHDGTGAVIDQQRANLVLRNRVRRLGDCSVCPDLDDLFCLPLINSTNFICTFLRFALSQVNTSPETESSHHPPAAFRNSAAGCKISHRAQV